MHIIIRGKASIGKTRSEQEENLRKGGWGGSLTDEQLDKCKHLEKKAKEQAGLAESFVPTTAIDEVK